MTHHSATAATGTHLDVLGDVHLAGPQVAQARLLDHLAALVGVGDAQRQAAAAGLGAGAPGGGLAHAVLVPAPHLGRGGREACRREGGR